MPPVRGFYTTIARFYDAEHTDKTDDLALYSELAEEYGGPIFEVGCGSGRVMLHLAQQGYDVHGIDNDATMLERGKRKIAGFPHLRAKMTFIQGDVLTYDIKQRYKLVLLSYNSLMHFHEQETQIALLKRLRAVTDDDGLLVIDLPNAGEAFATQDSDAIALERTFIEPETGHLVMQQAYSTLDRVEQLMHVTWVYDEITGDGVVQRTLAPIIMRYYFYSELRLLLAAAGFEVEEVFGDPDHGPLEDGCPRMIVLARPLAVS